MHMLTYILSMLIFFLLTVSSLADELYIEGINANGESVYGYIKVDDTNIVDGFVEDAEGNIIFLEDEEIEKDAFGQIPEFEDDVDFFEQDYEINLEEE